MPSDVFFTISYTFSTTWNVASPIPDFAVADFELVDLMIVLGDCPLQLIQFFIMA